MSIFKKIWRLFKVAKVLMSLNSGKFTRITSLLSSPSPRRLEFAHSHSLSDCIYDFEDYHEHIFSEKSNQLQDDEVQKVTPSVSASTTPSSISSPMSEQFSSEEDINKKADDFISKMKRQISLDVAYTRSPSPPLPFGAPISPDSYFNQMKKEESSSSVQSPVISPVLIKPSSLNIKHPADSSRINKRPSLVVHRRMIITS